MDMLSFINQYSDSLTRFALTMLWQSSLLILILLLLDCLLRRRVKALFRYCLWMLVLAKLLLPVGLALPCSPAYWASRLLPETKKTDTAPAQTGLADAKPAPAPVDKTEPYPLAIETRAAAPHAEPLTATEARSGQAPIEASIKQKRESLSWQSFVGLGWLGTVLIMLSLLIQRAFFVNGLIRQSRPADDTLLAQLNRCAEKMGLRACVDVRISSNATSPSVCGLFRPVILMPDQLGSHLSRGQIEAVLMHELAHIKRADLWINLLQALLQIVYFYNPLLWLANSVIRRIGELAVDEMVLVALDEQAQDYPETLLRVSKLVWSKPMLSLRLIGVVESKSALSGRIRHILSRPFPRSARLGIWGVTAILAAAAVLLPMAMASGSAESRRVKSLIKILQDDNHTQKRGAAAEELIKRVDNTEVTDASGEKALVAITNRLKKHPKTLDRQRDFISYPNVYWDELALGFELIVNNKVTPEKTAAFLKALELVGCSHGVEADGVVHLFGEHGIPRRDIVINYRLRCLSVDGKRVGSELLDVFTKAAGASTWGREIRTQLEPKESLKLELQTIWYLTPGLRVESLAPQAYGHGGDDMLRDIVKKASSKKLCEYYDTLTLSQSAKWQGIFSEDLAADNKDAAQCSATLPSGMTVKLLSICEIPESGDNANWWKPDGTRLANRPFDRSSVSSKKGDSLRGYCLAYAIPGESEYQGPCRIEIEINGNGIRAAEDNQQLPSRALGHAVLWLPRDLDSTHISFSFRGGPWHTLRKIKAYQQAFSFGEFKAYITPPKMEDGQYVVHVRETMPQTFDQTYFKRYVIKLKGEPRLIDMNRYASTVSTLTDDLRPIDRLYVLDRNLQGKIEYIAAQYCVQQNAVFKNVSLAYGHETKIQIDTRQIPEPDFIYMDMKGPPAPVLRDLASGIVKGIPQLVMHAVHPQTLWQVLRSDRAHKPKWYFRVSGKDYPWDMSGHFAFSGYELIEGDCFPSCLVDEEKKWEKGSYTLAYVVKNTVWQDPTGKRRRCKELVSNTIAFRILADGSFASLDGQRFPTERERRGAGKNTQN